MVAVRQAYEVSAMYGILALLYRTLLAYGTMHLNV